MTHVLVIDDDEQMREMLAQMITREGYSVSTAVDGEEGLATMRRQPADLVVTDILMPKMDGIDLIVELRRAFPDVKILAISGGRRSISPGFNLQSAALVSGCAVLSKPFTRDQLVGRIRSCLTTYAGV
jgi:DNA-binding response OmpR family regulator